MLLPSEISSLDATYILPVGHMQAPQTHHFVFANAKDKHGSVSPNSERYAPYTRELDELVQLISQRVGRCLERQGLLEQDTGNAWLDLDPAENTDAMPQTLGISIFYRIAVGPQLGRKAFMIRTIRPLDRPDPRLERVTFEPVDFVARLVALVPKPRVNLTRYHGVLAPNHRWRGLVKVN